MKISTAAFSKNGIQNGSIDVYFPFKKQNFENKLFLIHFVTIGLHKMLAQVDLLILRFFILKKLPGAVTRNGMPLGSIDV